MPESQCLFGVRIFFRPLKAVAKYSQVSFFITDIRLKSFNSDTPQDIVIYILNKN
jgi:hypothetical protein